MGNLIYFLQFEEKCATSIEILLNHLTLFFRPFNDFVFPIRSIIDARLTITLTDFTEFISIQRQEVDVLRYVTWFMLWIRFRAITFLRNEVQLRFINMLCLNEMVVKNKSAFLIPL